MPTLELVIRHPAGLHARPASLFVEMANRFPCELSVSNLSEDSAPANAKSILGILSIGVKHNQQIQLQATGEQAEQALRAIADLVQSNFGDAAHG